MLWRTVLIYLFIIIFTNPGLFDEGEGSVNKECLHKPKKRKLCECKKCGFVAKTNEERDNHVCEVNIFVCNLTSTVGPRLFAIHASQNTIAVYNTSMSIIKYRLSFEAVIDRDENF